MIRDLLLKNNCMVLYTMVKRTEDAFANKLNRNG